MSKRKKQVMKGADKSDGVVTASGEVKPLGGPISVQPGGDPSTLGAPQAAQPGPAPGQPPVGQPAEGSPPPTNQQQPQQGQQPPATGQEPAPDPRFAKYTESLNKNGQLSPEEITQAAKDFNVPEAVVKAYADSLSPAPTEALVAAAHEAVGGQANWAGFAAWANANMSDDAVNTMMEALQGKSPAIAKALVTQAYEAFKRAGGGPGPTDASQGGSPPANPGVQGFASKDEQNQAIRDPRYKKDANYRAQVEARIAASRFT